jgi:hypothetical protein
MQSKAKSEPILMSRLPSSTDFLDMFFLFSCTVHVVAEGPGVREKKAGCTIQELKQTLAFDS